MVLAGLQGVASQARADEVNCALGHEVELRAEVMKWLMLVALDGHQEHRIIWKEPTLNIANDSQAGKLNWYSKFLQIQTKIDVDERSDNFTGSVHVDYDAWFVAKGGTKLNVQNTAYQQSENRSKSLDIITTSVGGKYDNEGHVLKKPHCEIEIESLLNTGNTDLALVNEETKRFLFSLTLMGFKAQLY